MTTTVATPCPCLTDDSDATKGCYGWEGMPYNSLICTRATGHDGPHIACTETEHGLATWRDDDDDDSDNDSEVTA